MKLSQLKEILATSPQAHLRFRLPDATEVAPHFHVTEIAFRQKKFIDCGGTLREIQRCGLQLWVALDVQHRLPSSKLLNIINIAEKQVLPQTDLEVDIEHQRESLSLYDLESVQSEGDALIFQLSAIHAACLAPDLCGLTPDLLPPIPSCRPGSGCC